MFRHTLRNLLLLGLTSMLALAVWWTEHPSGDAKSAAVVEVDPGSLRKIEIVRPDRDRVVLQREGPVWSLLSPWPVQASPLAVSALLGLATGPSLANYPLQTPERFGLSPPQATVYLDRTRLDLGTTDPIDHRRYVAQGNRLHLIRDSARPFWKGSESLLVGRNPIPSDARVVGLYSSRIDLQDDGKGGWYVSRPSATDPEFPQRLITAWRQLRASRVLEIAAAPEQGEEIHVELSQPYGQLTFTLQESPQGPRLLRHDLGLAWQFHPGALKFLSTLPTPEGKD